MTLHPDGHGPAVLDVSVHPSADGVVLVLVGELDMATAPVLLARVAELRVQGRLRPPAGVVVDLSSVSALDVSGVSALLEARRLVDGAGCPFAVTGASPVDLRLLRLTGLDAVLGVRSGDDLATADGAE